MVPLKARLHATLVSFPHDPAYSVLSRHRPMVGGGRSGPRRRILQKRHVRLFGGNPPTLGIRIAGCRDANQHRGRDVPPAEGYLSRLSGAERSNLAGIAANPGPVSTVGRRRSYI